MKTGQLRVGEGHVIRTWGFQEAGRELGEEDLGSGRKPPKAWAEWSQGLLCWTGAGLRMRRAGRRGSRRSSRGGRRDSAIRGEPRAGPRVRVGGGSVRGRWELTQWLEGLVQSPVPFTGNHPLGF